MKVILYSKPNCPYCDKVKEFIKNPENNITGVEYDETQNVAEIRKFEGMQFPMLKVVDEASGEEQGIFESEVIMQVLKQIYSK